MNKQHIILAAAWICYGILHSLLASSGFKQLLKKRFGEKFVSYRLFYTFFAATGLIAIILFQASISLLALFKPNAAVRISGQLIAVAGLAIMIVCIKKYFMQTSGLRWLIESNSTDKLMITGIHRFVRHPLYLGTFIFIWGCWLIAPSLSLLISNFIITAYTLIGIQFEEKKLVTEFGEAYKEYRKKVPMIIPRL